MKYTQIPETTFQDIQLNAGILTDDFDPETGEIGNLLGATSGGVSFNDDIEYKDFGEDIDNCPKNTKELKKLDSREVRIGGTFVTINAATAKKLAAAADIDELNAAHIIPRNELVESDFEDIWWIGDYSDNNTGENAGYIAIHMMNALNTGGFQIQSTDKEKGKFAFEFTGHYSMEEQEVVPYEIFIKNGGSASPSIVLNKHVATVKVGSNITLVANTIPSDATVAWTSGTQSKATISNGVVTGVAVGSSIITASITEDGVEYNDTCTVIVEAAD